MDRTAHSGFIGTDSRDSSRGPARGSTGVISNFAFPRRVFSPFVAPSILWQMFTVLRRFSILMTMIMERYILKTVTSPMVQVGPFLHVYE